MMKTLTIPEKKVSISSETESALSHARLPAGISIQECSVRSSFLLNKKAGEPGWKAFVPLYREYTLFHLAWADKYFWLWLGLLVAVQLSRGSKGLFGILGGLLALVFGIALTAVTWVSRRRLAAAFGKDKNFATGLFLLGPVFMLMLGCSSAKYLGPDPAPIEETTPVIKPYMEKIEKQLKQ